MASTSLAKRDKNFLSKELLPFHSVELYKSYSAFDVIQNPDPVLLYLIGGNEEAYRIAERNDATISSSREKRDSTLLSQRSRIVVGSSDSKFANKLQRFTVSAFKQIRNWATVEKKIQDAFYWGWRPMEIIWNTNFRWERGTYWVPFRLIEKKPEYFRFTPNRDLAFLDKSTGNYKVFSDPIEKLKWLICTYDSLDNPYGTAIYSKVWLHHFAKDRFFEMFASGMQRSMGLIKVKEGIKHPQSSLFAAATTETARTSGIMTELAAEISSIIEFLNSHNVLLERAGWNIEFVNNISFADGWIKAMEYIDTKITEIIATESLSWKESEFGSRAQAVVHSESGLKTAMGDGRVRDEWINEGIIEPMLTINFGEIDPEDMPKHQSYATIPLSLVTVKQASEMGIDLDQDEISYRFNLPVARKGSKNIIKGRQLNTTGPTKDGGEMDSKKKVQQADEESRNAN